MAPKRKLGKGLDALFATTPKATQPAPSAEADRSNPHVVDLDEIALSPHQPRRTIDADALDELARSIEAQGVIEPIVVRPGAPGAEKRFELIAGERRWRAAARAGLTSIPVVVRIADDRQAAAIALIENIQREDLNPLEVATGLKNLQTEFDLSQEALAELVGKSRPAVANLLRLLNLSPDAQTLVDEGLIEMGHARALLALPIEQQAGVGRRIARERLSVRQAERLVRRLLESLTAEEAAKEGAGEAAKVETTDSDTARLAREVSEKIGARVAINHKADGKGQIVIRYSSLDELDGILNRF